MLSGRLRRGCILAFPVIFCAAVASNVPLPGIAAPEEIASLAGSLNSGTAADPRNPFKLSAQTTVVPDNEDFTPIQLRPDAPLRGFTLSGKANLRQTDGPGSSSIGSKKFNWHSRYSIESGCVLLRAQASLLVDAGPVKVFIGDGTTAVVHTTKEATRLVNLTDHKRYSMRVTFGKHYVDLDPSFELVLVPKMGRNQKDVAIQEDIGWKDMSSMSSDDMCVFIFRVRAADMLKKCHIYRQLNESPLAIDHRLRDELVKSVAALEVMFNRHQGPFAVDTAYGYGSNGKPRESGTRETARR